MKVFLPSFLLILFCLALALVLIVRQGSAGVDGRGMPRPYLAPSAQPNETRTPTQTTRMTMISTTTPFRIRTTQTATNTPARRPTAANLPTVKVTTGAEDGMVNLRAAPTRGSKSLRVLREGEELTLLDTRPVGGWYLVMDSDGSTGYVYGEFLTLP